MESSSNYLYPEMDIGLLELLNEYLRIRAPVNAGCIKTTRKVVCMNVRQKTSVVLDFLDMICSTGHDLWTVGGLLLL